MPYLSVDQIDTVIVNLSNRYPATSQLITLPNATVDGRVSHALQLGAGQPGTRETFMLTGGVHAREWGSSEILLCLGITLLRAYQDNTGLQYGGTTFTAQEIRTLLETVHLVIFPLVNPDGLAYSRTPHNAMWRKNRQPSACGHAEHDGVDINRNFEFLFDYRTAFHWNSGVSVTDDACDDNETDVYQGPAAFSEAESRNVRWLMNRYTRLGWYVDVHNYGETMMYSWGDDINQTIDPSMNFTNHQHDHMRGVNCANVYGEWISLADLGTAQALAAAFQTALQPVRGRVYTTKPSFELYPTCGATDDYTFSRHDVDVTLSKAYSFTLEFGTAFSVPWNEMLSIILEVDAGLIGMCLAAAATAIPPLLPAQGGPPADNSTVV